MEMMNRIGETNLKVRKKFFLSYTKDGFKIRLLDDLKHT